ncbi:MAG: RecX family transcriptional regulator [Pseudomonadota bacterium]
MKHPFTTPDPQKTDWPKRMENWALFYLQRFACSRAGLARYLTQKLRRVLPKEEAELRAMLIETHIPPLVAKLEGYGYLNDTAYATGLARRLMREGKSLSVMRQKMQEKGLSKDDIEAAVALLQDNTGGDITLIAAVRLMQRRRIGCFTAPGRDPQPEKQIGILARAGFDYATIRAVSALTHDEAEALLDTLRL